MDTFWEKLKFWTRTILFALVALYVVIVVGLNWSVEIPSIRLIFKSYENARLLPILLLDSVVSIVGWWLMWTLFRALRQRRAAGDRKRIERLERANAEMQQKAGSLRTKPEAGDDLAASDPQP